MVHDPPRQAGLGQHLAAGRAWDIALQYVAADGRMLPIRIIRYGFSVERRACRSVNNAMQQGHLAGAASDGPASRVSRLGRDRSGLRTGLPGTRSAD